MKYSLVVYFAGPRSVWSGVLEESEAIYVGETRWLWLARAMARTHLGNTGRCGYVITADNEVVEHVHAKVLAVEPL